MGCICPNSKNGENIVILDFQEDKFIEENGRRATISSKKSDKFEKSNEIMRSNQELDDANDSCNKTSFAESSQKNRKSKEIF
jgi:hypothetical protein